MEALFGLRLNVFTRKLQPYFFLVFLNLNCRNAKEDSLSGL